MSNNLFYKLSVNISKQGSRFVAYSPAFDIATSGKTEKDVQKNFEALVQAFLEEIIEEGTVHDVLKEPPLGWKKEQKKWFPPQMSSKSISIRVPAFA